MVKVIARHEIRRQHPTKEGVLEVIAPETEFESSGDELQFFRDREAVYKSPAQARAMKRAQEGIHTAEAPTGIQEVALDPEVDANTTAQNRSTAAKAEIEADRDRKAQLKAEERAAKADPDDDKTESEKLGQDGGEKGVAGSMQPAHAPKGKDKTGGRRLT